ncbi:hypothetical protein PsorP6_019245 [Peronosclerospora sorghi]|nr:hypothetical protein PsorP6_019245 [Peronosclerospora sorghi]
MRRQLHELVCPVLNCKQSITEEDMKRIISRKDLTQYRAVLRRKRDEKNPSARWCPRPGCGELIICESANNFTCPRCGTFWFCRGEDDKSYLAWKASAGKQKAVRACPHCQMRIWKNEGCNDMTCTNCRYECCWICESTWDASHYACYDLPMLGASTAWGRSLQRILGYTAIVLIVTVIVTFGFYAFVGGHVLFCALMYSIRLARREPVGAIVT